MLVPITKQDCYCRLLHRADLGVCGIGVRQGRVIKPPAAPASDKKMDGVLAYNEGQASFNCSFGAFQVS